MTPVLDRDGYPRVVFRVDGKHYTRKVHRLVCEAFNGPPNALHRQVDHIDGDRANAAATNLRWVSHGENIAFRHRVGDRSGEKNGKALLTNAAVHEIRRLRGSLPVKDMATKFGVSPLTVYDVLAGKTWRQVS